MIAIARRWHPQVERLCARSRLNGEQRSVHYLMMVKEELGPEWLDPHWFRFGASSLANDILMQLQKEADGHYQSADYFSVD